MARLKRCACFCRSTSKTLRTQVFIVANPPPWPGKDIQVFELELAFGAAFCHFADLQFLSKERFVTKGKYFLIDCGKKSQVWALAIWICGVEVANRGAMRTDPRKKSKTRGP